MRWVIVFQVLKFQFGVQTDPNINITLALPGGEHYKQNNIHQLLNKNMPRKLTITKAAGWSVEFQTNKDCFDTKGKVKARREDEHFSLFSIVSR